MKKLKASVTITYEYVAKGQYYPSGASVEEIIRIDKENFENNPDLILEMGDTIECVIVEVK